MTINTTLNYSVTYCCDLELDHQQVYKVVIGSSVNQQQSTFGSGDNLAAYNIERER
jgi:hypothetical protein